MTRRDKEKLLIGLNAEFFGEGDTKVSENIRRMAMVLMPIASELRDASASGVTTGVIDWLRSDADILTADRDLLADVLQGDLGRQIGRPETKTVQKTIKKALADEVVAAYRDLRSRPPRPKKDDAAQIVANDYGMTLDRVLSLVKKAPRKKSL